MGGPTVFNVEFDRETDGRWIAEVIELRGVMAYGDTREAALIHAQALAFRVLADIAEQEGSAPSSVTFREQVA